MTAWVCVVQQPIHSTCTGQGIPKRALWPRHFPGWFFVRQYGSAPARLLSPAVVRYLDELDAVRLFVVDQIRYREL